MFVFSAGMTAFAQNGLDEPNFIGEVILISPDNTPMLLEKSSVQIKTKANASTFIVGIGKAKSKITIDGPKASTRIPNSADIKLLVKAVDNASDPMSIINVFKMEASKKERKAELSSLSTFGSHSSNNLELMKFKAVKFRDSSYLITLVDMVPGEYGVTVKNPNNLDERSIIVSTFAID